MHARKNLEAEEEVRRARENAVRSEEERMAMDRKVQQVESAMHAQLRYMNNTHSSLEGYLHTNVSAVTLLKDSRVVGHVDQLLSFEYAKSIDWFVCVCVADTRRWEREGGEVTMIWLE